MAIGTLYQALFNGVAGTIYSAYTPDVVAPGIIHGSFTPTQLELDGAGALIPVDNPVRSDSGFGMDNLPNDVNIVANALVDPDDGVVIAFRFTFGGTDTGYYVQWTAGTLFLLRQDGPGNIVPITNVAMPIAVPTAVTFTVDITGSAITVTTSEGPGFNEVDATYAAGSAAVFTLLSTTPQPGPFLYNDVSWLDIIVTGELPPVPTPPDADERKPLGRPLSRPKVMREAYGNEGWVIGLDEK